MHIVEYIKRNEDIAFKFGEGILNLAYIATCEENDEEDLSAPDFDDSDIEDITEEQFIEYIKPSNEQQEEILSTMYNKLLCYNCVYTEEKVTPFFHTTNTEIHKAFSDDIEISYKGETYIIFNELLEYMDA